MSSWKNSVWKISVKINIKLSTTNIDKELQWSEAIDGKKFWKFTKFPQFWYAPLSLYNINWFLWSAFDVLIIQYYTYFIKTDFEHVSYSRASFFAFQKLRRPKLFLTTYLKEQFKPIKLPNVVHFVAFRNFRATEIVRKKFLGILFANVQ